MQIANEEEYSMLIKYLRNEFEIPEEWSKSQRRALKEKAEKFHLVDDQHNEAWPKCPRLHLVKLAPNGGVISSKLFVPKWHHSTVLQELHGHGAIGGHFGRNRLHKLVRSIHSIRLTFLFRLGRCTLVSLKRMLLNS